LERCSQAAQRTSGARHDIFVRPGVIASPDDRFHALSEIFKFGDGHRHDLETDAARLRNRAMAIESLLHAIARRDAPAQLEMDAIDVTHRGEHLAEPEEQLPTRIEIALSAIVDDEWRIAIDGPQTPIGEAGIGVERDLFEVAGRGDGHG
jgi:hypothetical protein